MKAFKSYCNYCKVQTNHSVVKEYEVPELIQHETEEGVEEAHYLGSYTYQIIACKGCDNVSFRQIDFFKSAAQFDTSSKSIKLSDRKIESYYPQRLTGFLVEKRFSGIPFQLKKAYREVLDAYNADMTILCGVGVRMLVEGMCQSNGIGVEKQSLYDRIKILMSSGLIGANLAESLDEHRLLGNDAVHGLIMPEKEELKNAIELVELCFESIYNVQGKRNRLAEFRNKRISK